MKEFPAAITALEGVKLVKLIFETFLILKFILCFMKCTALVSWDMAAVALCSHYSSFLNSDSYPQLPQHFSAQQLMLNVKLT